MTFSCGCAPPTYCPTHRYAACHREPDGIIGTRWTDMECPACRSERWRSVTLDARATPTRKGG